MKHLVLLLIAVLICTPALPQGKGVKLASATVMTASTEGYMAAMRKMDKGMNFQYTGDADIDLVRGMIPHHQGAVDMCKVELQYGKNPEIRETVRKYRVLAGKPDRRNEGMAATACEIKPLATLAKGEAIQVLLV